MSAEHHDGRHDHPDGRHWGTTDVPDLTGRTAVVTGANSGLGRRTALELARHGASVVLACRDERRGAEALADVRREVPHARASLGRLDLADLASVRTFATSVLERGGRLDLLVNNAGVMAIPHRRTADGFEMQLGTNHLGHFALTGLLLPALLADLPAGVAPPAGTASAREPDPARVVTVSSSVHRIGRIAFEDLQSDRRYNKWRAYGQSKLANLLFMRELDTRAHAAGAPLVSVAAHPGYARTELQATGPRMAGRAWQARVTGAVNRVLAQSAHAGSLPSLRAATDPGVRSGEYFGPAGPGEVRGHPVRVGMSAAARDDEVARRLWEVSERLTGVSYEALDRS